MNVRVTTVSRGESTIGKSPAAAFILTTEMIRRSGATSVPEVLRLVPGLQAARIDAHRWAIAVRGLNAEFSNKLLVLIDGRAISSPVFSRVRWDMQDPLLGDIERHARTWGGGYRLIMGGVVFAPPLRFDESSRNIHLGRLFLRDDIKLVDEKLTLTLGSQFQYYSFSGFDYQPTERQTARAAVSRALRTPSWVDNDLRVTTAVPPRSSLPNKDLHPESVLSHELGYRAQPHERCSVDLALVGLNLLDSSHPEFLPGSVGFLGQAREIPRGIYGTVTWRF